MINENLSVRMGRARSWTALAERERVSEHAKFVFYWVTFNCLYGWPPIDPENLDKEPESQMVEIREFLARLKELARIDRENGTNILHKAIARSAPSAKSLIENPFLSYEYWEGDVSPERIRNFCEQDWTHAKEALDKGNDFTSILHLSFYRLTVLRNQVIHGSATASPASMGYKDSLQPGLRFLQVIIPALLELMEKYGDSIQGWRKAPYPRRGHRDHPHT